MNTSNICTKVTVRQAKFKNGMISLYLNYYLAIRNPKTMKPSRREYLGIYIYASPKNQMEMEFMSMVNMGKSNSLNEHN